MPISKGPHTHHDSSRQSLRSALIFFCRLVYPLRRLSVVRARFPCPRLVSMAHNFAALIFSTRYFLLRVNNRRADNACNMYQCERFMHCTFRPNGETSPLLGFFFRAVFNQLRNLLRWKRQYAI